MFDTSKKKVSNRKEMSAIELALRAGTFLIVFAIK
jgi:hypothetical protein